MFVRATVTVDIVVAGRLLSPALLARRSLSFDHMPMKPCMVSPRWISESILRLELQDPADYKLSLSPLTPLSRILVAARAPAPVPATAPAPAPRRNRVGRGNPTPPAAPAPAPLAQDRAADNFLVAAARRVATIVAAGALRRLPKTDRQLLELVGRVVSVTTSTEIETLGGQPAASKRFSVYMAVAFVVGRRNLRGLRQHIVTQIKAAVRSSQDYQELLRL